MATDAKNNEMIAVPTGPKVSNDKQSKPLLDGVEEEKYGANGEIVIEQEPKYRSNRSSNNYANYNNPNYKFKKRNLYKLYEKLSIFGIIGLMTVTIYFNTFDTSSPFIQIMLAIIWSCRILIRVIGLFVNDRWYFGSKSKFTKLKAELFKFKEFGKISLIWIILSIFGCCLLLTAPFIPSWCGSISSKLISCIIPIQIHKTQTIEKMRC